MILAWAVCSISLIPSSQMRELYAAIPKQIHWDIREELNAFDQFSKNETIAVQTSLGTHFNRTGILAITDDKNGNCAPTQRNQTVEIPKYLVFAKSLNHYLIDDLEQCIKRIELSKDYESLSEYNHLSVYKKID